MAGIKTILRNIYSSGGGGSSFTFNTNDFDVVADAVSIDYANGQAASGSAKGFLTSSDWTTFNSKMTNPMTTAGDIIVGGPSGSPTRLAAGTLGYVLTGNGAGVLPSYQAPAGVAVPLGTIFTDTWANLSSWTTVAGTFSVASNQLTVNGGSPATPQVGNYLRNSGYGLTNLEEWTIEAEVIVGTISATSWGVGFALQRQITLGGIAITAAVLMDSTNRGKVGFLLNSSSTLLNLSQAITINTSDALGVVLKRVKDRFVITITNKTTNPGSSTSSTYVYNFDYVAGQFAPGASNFCITALGGTDHKVSSGFTIKSDHFVNADYWYLGDSEVTGYFANEISNRAADVISGNFTQSFVANAGGGNSVESINASEVLAHAPRGIVISLGVNNLGLGDSPATIVTKLNTLISSLTGYTLGTNLWVTTLRPANTVDVTAVNTAIRTAFSPYVIDLYYPAWSGTGTSANSIYILPDNVHFNRRWHRIEADILSTYLRLTPKAAAFEKTLTATYSQSNGFLQVSPGNVGYSPYTPLDVVNTNYTTQGAQMRIGISHNVNDGLYFFSTSGSEGFMSAGAQLTTSTVHTARATSAGLFGFNGGTAFWALNTGLTAGNTFTPTYRMNLTTTGLRIGSVTAATARLHIDAGSATANTAPLKFTSGPVTTVAVAGQMEYDNTFHLTNSDATRRHIVLAPNTTKVTAGAPYTNDGYIVANIGGTDFKLMTTA